MDVEDQKQLALRVMLDINGFSNGYEQIRFSSVRNKQNTRTSDIVLTVHRD